MTVSAGARRHRVRLQHVIGRIDDGAGGYVEEWEDLDPASAMAAIVPATARELARFAGGSTVIATASDIVTLPHHAGITATDTRILAGARILRVLGYADPEARGLETVCACSELVP